MYRIRTPNGLHLAENDPSQNTTQRAQRDDEGKCALSANNVSDDALTAHNSPSIIKADIHLHALLLRARN